MGKGPYCPVVQWSHMSPAKSPRSVNLGGGDRRVRVVGWLELIGRPKGGVGEGLKNPRRASKRRSELALNVHTVTDKGQLTWKKEA